MKKPIPARRSGRTTFRPRLECLEARLTPSAYAVSNLADAGPGSLRAAITSVNGDNTYGNHTPDVIDFSVAGVIKLTSGPLPAITYSVKIDGTSAPGFAGAPLVEIDNNGFAGLTFNTGESGLASLSIVNASGAGVTLDSLLGSFGPPFGGDTIVGNYIGLALDGSVAANTGAGLLIVDTSDTIGGTTALDRNVISGNGAGGIQVGPSDAGSPRDSPGLSETIRGNFIGTDPAGQAAAPNQGNGITVFGGNQFGGSVIGGTDPGDSNIIAYNTQYGVDTSQGNAIRENSVYQNGAGGILLNGNNNQPAPILTAAFQPTSTTIEVSGIVSAPGPTGLVEIFATPTGTPTGQGKNFVGSVTAVPISAGVATFDFRSTFDSSSGNSFTATFTAEQGFVSGNTSAFSPAIALGGNANTVFVGSAYALLLNRAPDAGGATFWVNGLNSQTFTPASVVLGIEGSREYITDQIDAMYPRYLNRPAGPQDKQTWAAFIQAGGTFEQVAAALVNSQEFYVLNGGTDQGFITGLYADILKRGATTAELAYWETVLNSGASRASVAIYVPRLAGIPRGCGEKRLPQLPQPRGGSGRGRVLG